MNQLSEKRNENFIDATEYLLRINTSVNLSIRNICSLLSEAGYIPLKEIEERNFRLTSSRVPALIDSYNDLNQDFYCNELINLSTDDNLLIFLRAKFLSFERDDHILTYRELVFDQIKGVNKLLDLTDKWNYYTEKIANAYDGDFWDIFSIIDKIAFVRISIYTLKLQLYRVFPNQNQVSESPLDKRLNAFNNMPIPEVEKWFMQLADRKNKRGEPILTENEVYQFIRRAFCKTNEPKLKPNHGKQGKWNFIRLFYLYYIKCTSGKQPIDERPTIRDEYIKLISDNFEDFELDDIRKNFASSIHVGKAWKLL